jgi:hypothetical protein
MLSKGLFEKYCRNSVERGRVFMEGCVGFWGSPGVGHGNFADRPAVEIK